MLHNWTGDREDITMGVAEEGGAVVKPTWLRSGLINPMASDSVARSAKTPNEEGTLPEDEQHTRCLLVKY